MAIDPVVMLSEELRLTEAALHKATQLYNQTHGSCEGRLVNMLLAKIKRLSSKIYETTPSSALGAADLIRLAANRYPFAHSRYASFLHDIADELSEGRRNSADLIWLRAVEFATREGELGPEVAKVAKLLDLAIHGAARPILVARTMTTASHNPHWRYVLSTHIPATRLNQYSRTENGYSRPVL